MSKVLKVFVVFIVILILSVILTPPLSEFLTMFKFEKIFNRLVMIFTVASAVIFITLPNLKKGGPIFHQKMWAECGFNFSAAPWKRLSCCGFLLGALTVAFMVWIEYQFGPISAKSTINFTKVFSWFVRGMASGVTVGIVEEFFFRGFMYRMLAKKLNGATSIILASIFYSLVHFLDNGQIFIPHNPTSKDALRLLFGYLEPFVMHPGDIVFEAAGLFLFGIVLNLAFVYTRSLFLSIGIHAGAVFFIKFQHAFVEAGPEAYHPFYGNTPLYDGPFEWAALVLLGLVVWQFSDRLAK